MNTMLLLTLLNGVMGGRGKRSRRASRYLTGGGGRLLSNPAMLMTAAGAAWGVFETLKGRNAPGSPPPPSRAKPAPADDAAGQPAALRMLRVAVSAAAADGGLNEREKAAILQQVGSTAAALLEAELAQPRPLAEVVSGVNTPEEAATLYVLAYTVLRADEQVTGAERIYLAQLAHLLALDTATVQALEHDTGERIDALGDQGQLGG